MVLTTTQFRQVKTFDEISENQSINLVTAHLRESMEISPPKNECCLQKSNNRRDLRNKEPAYIREVKARGMNTACHCFIQKTVFQQGNLGTSDLVFPICIPQKEHNFDTTSPHKTKQNALLLYHCECDSDTHTHHVIHSDAINDQNVWQVPSLHL